MNKNNNLFGPNRRKLDETRQDAVEVKQNASSIYLMIIERKPKVFERVELRKSSISYAKNGVGGESKNNNKLACQVEAKSPSLSLSRLFA